MYVLHARYDACVHACTCTNRGFLHRLLWLFLGHAHLLSSHHSPLSFTLSLSPTLMGLWMDVQGPVWLGEYEYTCVGVSLGHLGIVLCS